MPGSPDSSALFTPLLIVAGCFVLGAWGMYWSNRKVSRDTAKRRWTKFLVYVAVVHCVYGILAWGRIPALVLCGLLLIIGSLELWRAFRPNLRQPLYGRYFTVTLLLWLLIAAGALLAVWRYPAPALLYVYMVVALCDGFSQISGQLLGKTPLAPRISPNKTVEGLVGGVLTTVAVAYSFRYFYPMATVWHYAAMTLFLCLCGLTGDLAASKVKRLNGIKDYSKLLPEHGGILDRFDSFLVALAGFAGFGLAA